jgi:hypothetical protein
MGAAEDIRQNLSDGGKYIEEFGSNDVTDYSYEEFSRGEGDYYDALHWNLWRF